MQQKSLLCWPCCLLFSSILRFPKKRRRTMRKYVTIKMIVCDGFKLLEPPSQDFLSCQVYKMNVCTQQKKGGRKIKKYIYTFIQVSCKNHFPWRKSLSPLAVLNSSPYHVKNVQSREPPTIEKKNEFTKVQNNLILGVGSSLPFPSRQV